MPVRFAALRLLALALVAFTAPLGAQPRPQLRTPPARNVVLIVTDGLRWQELFTGAERALIGEAGGVEDTTATLRDFWRETPEARRAALFPFLWGTIAREGQLWGNQARGSVARITNPLRFSYPGYNEIFTGVYDPRIDRNGYPPNPNETVFEWLAAKAAFRGKVAAVATWDAFANILNRDRAGFPVVAGWALPFAAVERRSERQALIDELYATSVKLWPSNTFDAPMHLAAKEVIRTLKPRLLFVGYGETDEWQHTGRYDLLLRSARQVDAFIADLWRTMQAMPEYRGSTTFVITTDHGRGSGARRWRDHGRDVDGAEDIWIALLGAGVAPAGERANVPAVTQAQIAATIAALLGEDWVSRNPKAGRPLPR